MEAVKKYVERPIDQAAKSLRVGRSTLKRYCRDHGMPSWPLPKHSKKTVHTTDLKPSPKAWTKQNLQWPSNTRFGLAFIVFLMVRVKRWRNKKSLRNSLRNGDHPTVSESTAKPKYTINNIIPYSHVHASPKQTVANISDIKMVTVKATFKGDMIKFQFPTS
ncbi:putative transcription factor Nin-like family [Helianthus annuus]|uniref:Transcription factor Nin-like family n=1 Tax=Helianthus annuus TaxID=4232 RepID=A0A9K3DES2_HELAN|nr:uncharacterized protein LOC110925888 [Helianthus annuus]KAF5753795.1 putative transcription factor Nin-like family [Helianthus annuus]